MPGHRGRSPFSLTPKLGGKNSAGSKESPGAVARFLYSCGYEVVGQARKGAGGWFRCEVKDRRTGYAQGIRWVRPRPEGVPGFDVRKVDPTGVRALDVRCPTCGGPLEVLAPGAPVPADVCSRQPGDDFSALGLGTVLCVTVAQQLAEDDRG